MVSTTPTRHRFEGLSTAINKSIYHLYLESLVVVQLSSYCTALLSHPISHTLQHITTQRVRDANVISRSQISL
jgi:hypothetical protein